MTAELDIKAVVDDSELDALETRLEEIESDDIGLGFNVEYEEELSTLEGRLEQIEEDGVDLDLDVQGEAEAEAAIDTVARDRTVGLDLDTEDFSDDMPSLSDKTQTVSINHVENRTFSDLTPGEQEALDEALSAGDTERDIEHIVNLINGEQVEDELNDIARTRWAEIVAKSAVEQADEDLDDAARNRVSVITAVAVGEDEIEDKLDELDIDKEAAIRTALSPDPDGLDELAEAVPEESRPFSVSPQFDPEGLAEFMAVRERITADETMRVHIEADDDIDMDTIEDTIKESIGDIEIDPDEVVDGGTTVEVDADQAKNLREAREELADGGVELDFSELPERRIFARPELVGEGEFREQIAELPSTKSIRVALRGDEATEDRLNEVVRQLGATEAAIGEVDTGHKRMDAEVTVDTVVADQLAEEDVFDTRFNEPTVRVDTEKAGEIQRPEPFTQTIERKFRNIDVPDAPSDETKQVRFRLSGTEAAEEDLEDVISKLGVTRESISDIEELDDAIQTTATVDARVADQLEEEDVFDRRFSEPTINVNTDRERLQEPEFDQEAFTQQVTRKFETVEMPEESVFPERDRTSIMEVGVKTGEIGLPRDRAIERTRDKFQRILESVSIEDVDTGQIMDNFERVTQYDGKTVRLKTRIDTDTAAALDKMGQIDNFDGNTYAADFDFDSDDDLNDTLTRARKLADTSVVQDGLFVRGPEFEGDISEFTERMEEFDVHRRLEVEGTENLQRLDDALSTVESEGEVRVDVHVDTPEELRQLREMEDELDLDLGEQTFQVDEHRQVSVEQLEALEIDFERDDIAEQFDREASRAGLFPGASPDTLRGFDLAGGTPVPDRPEIEEPELIDEENNIFEDEDFGRFRRLETEDRIIDFSLDERKKRIINPEIPFDPREPKKGVHISDELDDLDDLTIDNNRRKFTEDMSFRDTIATRLEFAMEDKDSVKEFFPDDLPGNIRSVDLFDKEAREGGSALQMLQNKTDGLANTIKRSLAPSMRVWYSLIAAIVPLMITAAANVGGLVAAMGAGGAIGGAGLLMGLLGQANTLKQATKEAKSDIKELKEELFKTALPTMRQMAPLTEQFLGDLPSKMEPLLDSLSQAQQFFPLIDRGTTGTFQFLADLVDRIAARSGMISDLTFDLVPDAAGAISDGLMWLIEEAARNKTLIRQMGKTFVHFASILYNLSEAVTRIVVAFEPIFGVLAQVTGALSPFIATVGQALVIVTAFVKTLGFLQFALFNLGRLTAVLEFLAGFTSLTGGLTAAVKGLAAAIAGPLTASVGTFMGVTLPVWAVVVALTAAILGLWEAIGDAPLMPDFALANPDTDGKGNDVWGQEDSWFGGGGGGEGGPPAAPAATTDSSAARASPSASSSSRQSAPSVTINHYGDVRDESDMTELKSITREEIKRYDSREIPESVRTRGQEEK